MSSQQDASPTDDLRALALQLAVFTAALEQRGDRVIQLNDEAAQRISEVARAAAASAEQMTASALAQFRQAAAGAVSEGLQQSLEQVRYDMRHATQDVRGAAGDLEKRIRTTGRFLTAHAWKSFVASATASLAVLGVAAWIGWHTHQNIVRQEWIGMINAAVDHGRLAPCADEGLCARAGNRWVRIDR